MCQETCGNSFGYLCVYLLVLLETNAQVDLKILEAQNQLVVLLEEVTL